MDYSESEIQYLHRNCELNGYFEEQDLIIVHDDQSGKRIVGIPELQSETAPGAADEPDVTTQSAEAAE